MNAFAVQWTPEALLPAISAILALTVMRRLAGERRHASVGLLRTLLLAIAVWSLGSALETVATDLAAKLLGVRVAYAGVVAVPVLFLLWLASYLERAPSLRGRIALCALPAASWILAVTSDLHALLWIDPVLTRHDGFVGWTSGHGPVWKLQLVYGYSLVLATWLLMLQEAFSSRWARPHMLQLFLASLFPVVPSVLFASGISRNWLDADLTPATFAITVAFLALLADDPLRRRLPISREAIVDALQNALLVTDDRGLIVRLNAAASRLLGRPQDGLIGRPLDAAAPFVTLTEAPEPAIVTTMIEGTASDIEVRTSPIDDGARRVGWIVLLVDRTEEVYVEEAMKRAVEELGDRADALEASGRSRSRFLSTISHELRTPLGAIIGFAELLKDGMAGDLDEAEHALAQRIHETGTDLLMDVNSLLDLEKTEVGALKLRPERVDARRVAEDIQAALARRTPRPQVDLRVEAANVIEPIYLDESKLRQILVNLLLFVQARTPPRGEVTLRLASRGGWLEALCIQHGQDVRPPDAASLLEPFWETAQETLPGIGGPRAREMRLGMALVLRLVELHGGAFEMRQVSADTTHYRLRLPDLAPAHATQGEEALP